MRGKRVCSNCGLTIGEDGSCGCEEDTGCSECLEQARLLGMSGEREIDLRSQVERLERENAKLKAVMRQALDALMDFDYDKRLAAIAALKEIPK